MKSSPKSGLMRTCSVKSKLIWTTDLCDKFQKAVEKLGIDNAVPRKILELMKVKGLTRDNVASHLQKYRIVKKKLAASSNGVVIASRPVLLESSMTNEASWMNSLSMLNEQPKKGQSNSEMHLNNPPILDTSSTYVPVVEGSNFNATFELAYPGSLSVEGNYSMQEMSTNLDKQRNLINDDASNLGVANSLKSSSGFVQNRVGFANSYTGCLGEVDSDSNIAMDSSSGVHWNNELEMTWNHKKQIIPGNSKSSYYVENPGSSESHYSSQNEFVETGLMYGASSRDNMENELGEHDLVWDGAHLDYLLSCGNDNRKCQSISNDLPLNQVMSGEDFLNNDSFDSYQNNATTSIDLHQTLDGYLYDFDHISNMNDVTPGPPNQDVNDTNSPNIFPFSSNAELTSIDEVQTTYGNLPPCDQTIFDMNNVTLDSPNQDANGQAYFVDNFAFASNEATSINEDQTLPGFLSGFGPTYNMHNDEVIEPIWSPEPITNDMIRQGYF